MMTDPLAEAIVAALFRPAGEVLIDHADQLDRLAAAAVDPVEAKVLYDQAEGARAQATLVGDTPALDVIRRVFAAARPEATDRPPPARVRPARMPALTHYARNDGRPSG